MESSEYYELAMCSQLGDEFDYFRGDNMHVEPEQGLRTFQADDPMDEHGENRFLSTKHASVPNDVSYDSGPVTPVAQILHLMKTCDESTLSQGLSSFGTTNSLAIETAPEPISGSISPSALTSSATMSPLDSVLYATMPSWETGIFTSTDSDCSSLVVPSQRPSWVGLVSETETNNYQPQMFLPQAKQTSDNVYSCIEDCNSTLCKDGCTVDHCPPECITACEGDEICGAVNICEKVNCEDKICPEESSACADDLCPFSSFDKGWPNAFDESATASNSMLCQWENPGQPCDVSVPTADALGQHLLQDHLKSQTNLTCFVNHGAEGIALQQVPGHLLRQHHSDSYVCLWDHCRLSFSNDAALASHIQLAHTNVTCHWAGCGFSTTGLSQLKHHVNTNHLNFGPYNALQPSPSQLSKSPDMSPHAEVFSSPSASAYSSFQGQSASPTAYSYYPTIPDESQPVSEFIHHQPMYQANQQQYIQFHAPPSNAPTSSVPDAFGGAPTSFPHIPNVEISAPKPARKAEIHTCMWISELKPNQVCGSRFTDANDLQDHVDEDHIWVDRPHGQKGNPPHCNWQKCKRHGTPLQNREKLRRHVFTHTKFYVGRCDFCDRTFNLHSALKDHERMHTGEKPFACDLCDEAFATSAGLSIHRNHHTGEKKLTCEVCNYSCADISNMNKHKKTHLPREHFCPICSKGFHRSCTMVRHLEIHDVNRPKKVLNANKSKK